MSKRTKDFGASNVNLGLVVVPMLDMSFQLLSFFIMVYSPATGEEFIGADLQRSKTSSMSKDDLSAKSTKPKDKDKPPDILPPADVDPVLDDVLTVVLSRSDQPEALLTDEEKKASFKPKFLQIKDRAGPKAKFKIVETKDRAEDEYDEAGAFTALEKKVKDFYLETFGADAPKKDVKDAKDAKEGVVKTKIRIEAGAGIEFDYVIRVYAICRRAKFEDVNFTTPLD